MAFLLGIGKFLRQSCFWPILLDLLGPVRTLTKIEYGVCKKFENFCDHQTSFVLICNRVCTRSETCKKFFV